MAKLMGYIIALAGLVVLALSFVSQSIPLISAIPQMYVMFAGIIVIIVGIALSMMGDSSSSNVKQSSEEVPIYEGTGKKRKIVGYKREK
jgi:hypothetical protein